MRTTAKGLEYPNPFYWDINRNPYAIVKTCLADCTCFVYGAIIEDGHRPLTKFKRCDANSIEQSLINGWSRIAYDKSKLEKGDVIQWVKHCHVAVYTGNGEISGSFFTGMHGRAYYNGTFDTRTFKSLQECNDSMIKNYPDRFFHHWSIEKEMSWVKGKDDDGSPEYILKHPLYSVAENPSVDQIFASGDDMNVRNDKNEILKRAEKGYYNVLGWKDSNGYRWYEVEKGKYIAGYDGVVTYIPAKDDVLVRLQILENENAELNQRIEQIKELCSK